MEGNRKRRASLQPTLEGKSLRLGHVRGLFCNVKNEICGQRHVDGGRKRFSFGVERHPRGRWSLVVARPRFETQTTPASPLVSSNILCWQLTLLRKRLRKVVWRAEARDVNRKELVVKKLGASVPF